MEDNIMKKKGKSRPFWRKPMGTNDILKSVSQFLGENIDYTDGNVLGFPGTPPLPIAVQAYTLALPGHPNNITMHTQAVSEDGFVGTQEAERQVLAMVADLLGADYDEIDGYISSGGTEANITALWIGRNIHYTKTAVVYYFYTNTRCSSCNLIENYTRESVEQSFAQPYNGWRVEFRGVNVELRENHHFVQDYWLNSKSVVVQKFEGKKPLNWGVLKDVWRLLGNKPEFMNYVTNETRKLLDEK